MRRHDAKSGLLLWPGSLDFRLLFEDSHSLTLETSFVGYTLRRYGFETISEALMMMTWDSMMVQTVAGPMSSCSC